MTPGLKATSPAWQNHLAVENRPPCFILVDVAFERRCGRRRERKLLNYDDSSISALFSCSRWGFSPGPLFFAGSAAGDIRIIIVPGRRRSTRSNRKLSRALAAWRKPVVCRPSAAKNSRPWFD
jgi:hypothetical protein